MLMVSNLASLCKQRGALFLNAPAHYELNNSRLSLELSAREVTKTTEVPPVDLTTQGPESLLTNHVAIQPVVESEGNSPLSAPKSRAVSAVCRLQIASNPRHSGVRVAHPGLSSPVTFLSLSY